MADITMCTNVFCPNAENCYRVQAAPGEWQSYCFFHYSIGINGVVCDNYIANVLISTNNSTEERDGKRI